MQTDGQLATQINILTGVMAGGALLVGALLAYVKVSTSNAINAAVNQAKVEIGQKIQDSENRLAGELARKDLTEQRLSELDRRLSKTEAWKEAVTAVPLTPPKT